MRLVRAAACTLLLASPLGSCTAWRPRPVPSPGAAPTPVRVTLLDGRALVLARAVVVGDSLVGIEGRPPERRAIAVRDITRTEGRAISGPRTLGTSWLAINAAAGLILVAYLSGLII